MKHFYIFLFIIYLNIFNAISYASGNNFSQGYNQTFQKQNTSTFNQTFSNPNSYMDRNQHKGTTTTPQPVQHNLFDDNTRYNSNCQFGVCMPGGH